MRSSLLIQLGQEGFLRSGPSSCWAVAVPAASEEQPREGADSEESRVTAWPCLPQTEREQPRKRHYPCLLSLESPLSCLSAFFPYHNFSVQKMQQKFFEPQLSSAAFARIHLIQGHSWSTSNKAQTLLYLFLFQHSSPWSGLDSHSLNHILKFKGVRKVELVRAQQNHRRLKKEPGFFHSSPACSQGCKINSRCSITSAIPWFSGDALCCILMGRDRFAAPGMKEEWRQGQCWVTGRKQR